eukprot:m.193095 g.193095  ORF g.193095 m.193095 type:complete len:433 (-) comp18619_c0_seq1:43-1341(-)
MNNLSHVNHNRQERYHEQHRRYNSRHTRNRKQTCPNNTVACFHAVSAEDDPAQLSVAAVRKLRELATSGAYSVPLDFKMDIVLRESSGEHTHVPPCVSNQQANDQVPAMTTAGSSFTECQSGHANCTPGTPRSCAKRRSFGFMSPSFSLPAHSYIVDVTESPICAPEWSPTDVIDYDCDTDDENWLEQYNTRNARSKSKIKKKNLCIGQLELALSYALGGRFEEIRNCVDMGDHARDIWSYTRRKLSRTSATELIPRTKNPSEIDSAYTCFRPYDDCIDEPMAVYKRRRRPLLSNRGEARVKLHGATKTSGSALHGCNNNFRIHNCQTTRTDSSNQNRILHSRNQSNTASAESMRKTLPRHFQNTCMKLNTTRRPDDRSESRVVIVRNISASSHSKIRCPPTSCVGNRTRRRRPLTVLSSNLHHKSLSESCI